MTDESALLLTVSVYNDWHLVSIRIHTYLRRFLTTDAEFRLRRDEYKRLLQEQVYERHVKACEGCVTDHGSQRDHTCLRPPPNPASW